MNTYSKEEESNNTIDVSIGEKMYSMTGDLFPIFRSLTGAGIRETLQYIKGKVPEMRMCEIPSGTKVFDWVVPPEWEIREAWVEYEDGTRIIDITDSNLHIVGYSVSVDGYFNLNELQEHLYSLPEQPEVIPYVTSYYKERWGFCLSENQRKDLKEGIYWVHIDSEIFDGSLSYGEVILSGETHEEIFFSSYICHPSMANDSISGAVLAMQLIDYIKSISHRRYSYRFVFIPETIGSLTYMSRNLSEMKENIKAGFVLTTCGDDRQYSYLPSRCGSTLADRIALNILRSTHPDFVSYSFVDERGSDERQYCSPGADLPVCIVCRTKFHNYPEYHTSADNMDLVSPEGYQGIYDVFKRIIIALENNYYYRLNCVGEPQLGSRGLFPDVSKKGIYTDEVKVMSNLIAYADGKTDLITISDIIGTSVDCLIPICERLQKSGLLIVEGERKDA